MQRSFSIKHELNEIEFLQFYTLSATLRLPPQIKWLHKKSWKNICLPRMPGGGSRPLPHVGGVGLWVVVGGQRPGVTRASSRRRRAGGEEKEEQAAVGRTGRAHLPSQAAGKFCQSLQDWMHKPGRVLLTLFWFGLVGIPLHWIRMRYKPWSKHIPTIRRLQPKLTPTDFVDF